jgi:hypothetical protein
MTTKTLRRIASGALVMAAGIALEFLGLSREHR